VRRSGLKYMTYALILFAVTYVLMIALPNIRHWIALAGAAAFVLSGMLPADGILPSIDFNVLLMMSGMMGTVALVIESQAPQLLADILVEKMPNVKWTIVLLALFAGVVSAFIDNVATVLMIAPIAMAIAKTQNINPVGMMIAIAVSSNLQGAATLVGDTTAILLGGYAGMNFMDFFFFKGKPSIFFAVELGAILSALILVYLFRNENAHVEAKERTIVNDFFPTVLLCLTVLSLIVASFIPDTPEMINGIICVFYMVIGIIYNTAKKKKLSAITEVLIEIDFVTLGLLVGIFVIIGGIKEMGVIDKIAEIFGSMGGGSVFWIYTLLVWMSVVLSAFIDNIPYVATMLPVVANLSVQLGIDPTLLYFGLLSGATLGGNLTPIGASANITGIGILKKEGYEVSNRDFMRIGVPFTLAAVIPAYIYFLVVFY